jgi:hypothetical protein
MFRGLDFSVAVQVCLDVMTMTSRGVFTLILAVDVLVTS